MTTRPYPRCVCPDARDTVPERSITCQRCGRSLFPGDAEVYASRVMYCVNSAMLEQSLDISVKADYLIPVDGHRNPSLGDDDKVIVTAERKLGRYRTEVKEVEMKGFDTLTRPVARAALRVAFGDDCNNGVVWGGGIGYRVWPKDEKLLTDKQKTG